MSDDIVTRLRMSADLMQGFPQMKAQHFNAEWVIEAADDIERLRAAIRHLYFNEGVCYGNNCEQCELVYGLCDDKAVLG